MCGSEPIQLSAMVESDQKKVSLIFICRDSTTDVYNFTITNAAHNSNFGNVIDFKGATRDLEAIKRECFPCESVERR